MESLNESLHTGHTLLFNHYFMSPKLADELYQRQFQLTGTFTVIRLPKRIKFRTDKELKQEGRGSADNLVRNDAKIVSNKVDGVIEQFIFFQAIQ